MTPQLQQAIRLLQMSGADLIEYVAQAVEQNPFLEVPDEGHDPLAPGDAASPERSAEAPGPLEALAPRIGGDDTGHDWEPMAWDGDGSDDAGGDRAPRDFDYRSGEDPPGAGTGAGAGGDPGDDAASPLARLTAPRSLADHLADQIASLFAEPQDRLIAQALTGWLDDAGLFRDDPEDVAVMLGCPVRRVVAVLNRLKCVEPVGLFAQSLAECLELQLAERDQLDGPIVVLLENLGLVADGRLTELARLCGVDKTELGAMLALLRRLNPRPASLFGPATVPQRIPDILVQRQGDGSYLVELNPEVLPRVLVNQRYFEHVQMRLDRDDDRAFVQGRMAEAQWLVRALDQRARTTLRVASAIVRTQERFLRHGVMHLAPLTLRTIADALEVHESTVSRVTQTRSMATPRGIFELKYFFTQAIASRHASVQVSAESVRARIRTLIDQETPERVLSDDQIVEVLTAEGLEIARRTVAKYREAMGIASSARRRRKLRTGL